MKRLLIVGSSLLLVYLIGALLLYKFQERFIFLDGELDESFEFQFESEFEELNLQAPNGGYLNALHFKADSAKGLILYFHGNRGDLTRWGDIVNDYVKLNYDVLVMDYRGFGKSRGERSMKILLEDAELFYQYALKKYNEQEITLYGRSLGTGIASWLAGKHQPKRLILETPYYSLSAVAQRYYPIYPSKLALRYNFQSYKYLKTADCPVYIFHGTEDTVVPYKSAQKLYKSLPPDQVSFFTIEGGEHKNLATFDVFQKSLKEVLR
ncbi:alpha/beta hydrolase [Roseivirga sp.]|uniref:alpha/beta hydrolase n=1 Tax=Roseivirga sp. TaxID=1964215 RepID=UPI003B8DE0BB